jgi:GNAT superfamily N-acetyltransferase
MPYIKRHLNTDFFASLAEIDGQIVSTAYLATAEKPANASWPTGKIGTILNVFTFPEHRRKGCATACLNMLIDIAKRENCSYLELSASEMGKPVYEKLGFQVPAPSHFTPMRLSLL